MNELVQRLSQGEHPVEASLRPDRNAQALKECIDRGYVHIRFINTQGGTELGMQLDLNETRLDQANFTQETGNAHLVGNLTLNGVPVQCIANIDLSTLTGQGRLQPTETN
jgi:Core binding factor beta subunit